MLKNLLCSFLLIKLGNQALLGAVCDVKKGKVRAIYFFGFTKKLKKLFSLDGP